VCLGIRALPSRRDSHNHQDLENLKFDLADFAVTVNGVTVIQLERPATWLCCIRSCSRTSSYHDDSLMCTNPHRARLRTRTIDRAGGSQSNEPVVILVHGVVECRGKGAAADLVFAASWIPTNGLESVKMRPPIGRPVCIL
jgi:hypothetical protein